MHVRAQSCPTLRDPMDCSPPGSSVREIFQERVLEPVAMPFSRGSSRPRDQTHVFCISCIGRWILYHRATWEALKSAYRLPNFPFHFGYQVAWRLMLVLHAAPMMGFMSCTCTMIPQSSILIYLVFVLKFVFKFIFHLFIVWGFLYRHMQPWMQINVNKYKNISLPLVQAPHSSEEVTEVWRRGDFLSWGCCPWSGTGSSVM